MESAAVITANLQNYRRLGNYYTHSSGYWYSEGIAYLMEAAEAEWLFNQLTTISNKYMSELFQIWEVKVDRVNHQTSIVLTNSNQKLLYSATISGDNFPLDYVKLYFSGHTMLTEVEYNCAYLSYVASVTKFRRRQQP